MNVIIPPRIGVQVTGTHAAAAVEWIAGRIDSAADVKAGERVAAGQCDPGTTGTVERLYKSEKYFSGQKILITFCTECFNRILCCNLGIVFYHTEIIIYWYCIFWLPGPSYVTIYFSSTLVWP